MLRTCSLLDWMGLVAAELGATLLCCVSAPNYSKTTTTTTTTELLKAAQTQIT